MKNRFDKNDTSVEIIRFATKIEYNVMGGFSKLIKNINISDIITYSDNRYGTGDVYKKNGFDFVHETQREIKPINGVFYI